MSCEWTDDRFKFPHKVAVFMDISSISVCMWCGHCIIFLGHFYWFWFNLTLNIGNIWRDRLSLWTLPMVHMHDVYLHRSRCSQPDNECFSPDLSKIEGSCGPMRLSSRTQDLCGICSFPQWLDEGNRSLWGIRVRFSLVRFSFHVREVREDLFGFETWPDVGSILNFHKLMKRTSVSQEGPLHP